MRFELTDQEWFAISPLHWRSPCIAQNLMLRPGAEKRRSGWLGPSHAWRWVGIEETIRNDHGISNNSKDVE